MHYTGLICNFRIPLKRLVYKREIIYTTCKKTPKNKRSMKYKRIVIKKGKKDELSKCIEIFESGCEVVETRVADNPKINKIDGDSEIERSKK